MKLVRKIIPQNINKEEKYRRLKEDIKMIKSQISYAEKNKLIKECKRIGINEVIRQNNKNI